MSMIEEPLSSADAYSIRKVESPDIEEMLGALGRPDHECIMLGPRLDDHHLLLGRFGGLEIMSLRSSGALTWRSASTAGNLTIQVDLGSTPGARHNGQLLEADDLILYTGSAAYERRSTLRHHGMNFRIPLELAREAIEARAPESAALSPLGTSLIASGYNGSVARIRKIAQPILQWMTGSAAPPLACDALSPNIADVLVDSLLAPWRRASEGSTKRPYYQRLPVLQRAEAYMRAHLDQPLMLHHICVAARASERTVEYAFRDSYGVGVKQYLRLLRLAHVRRELRRSWSSDILVRDLAAKYGFWHLGHFAVAYRSVYGETPRETMRHSRM